MTSRGRNKKGRQDSSFDVESTDVESLEHNVKILTQNMLVMQDAINKMVIQINRNSENDRSDKEVNNKNVETDSKVRQTERGYISLFKDLGGNNIYFTPEGSFHPVDFMRKLTNAFDDAGVPPGKRIDLAINSLRGSAAIWASARGSNFDTFEEFSKAFLDRYWNVEDERSAFRRIQYGCYENGPRSEYFLKLVRENNYLTRPLTEKELVKILVKHFDQQVRRGILNNALDGIDEIDAYLRELDSTYEDDRNSRANRAYRPRNNVNYHRNENVNNRNNNNREQTDRGRENREDNNSWRRGEPSERDNTQEVGTAGRTMHLIASSSTLENTSMPSTTSSQLVTFNNDMEKDLLGEPEVTENTKKPHWPLLPLKVAGISVNALIDSGSHYNCVSESFFQILQANDDKLPTFPVSGLKIKGAIGSKQKRINFQILIELKVGGYTMETSCIVVPTLTQDLILGCEWLTVYKAKLNFENSVVQLIISEFPVEFPFLSGLDEPVVLSIITASEEVDQVSFKRPVITNYNLEDREAIINKTTMLDEKQKYQLLELLNQYQHIFSDQPGLTNKYYHLIILKDETPFYLRSYPVPHCHKKAAQLQIKEMLDWGVIELAQTEYISPLVVVTKKDGSIRVCLDARHLNSRMVKDHVIPPNPSELLYDFSEVRYLSTIDLTASYWQLPIHPDCKKYTGFQFDGHTYQFKVLPFGLSTSVGSFITALSQILGHLSFAIPYVDDILIWSPTITDHIEHLGIIFDKLSQAGFTVKLHKCLFARDSVNFLGHVLTPNGISIDPARIRAIQCFPRPINIKHLRSFLGACNYDRRFVDKYSDLTAPLIQLLRKGVRWSWTTEHEEAFQAVKKAYLEITFLTHPTVGKRFYIQSDSSGYGIGSCLFQINELSQEKNIIAFTSRSLKGSELNYCISEKEALAILHALRQWRTLVLGQPLTIVTDHKALSFLLKCRLLNSRLSRWTLFIQEYSFDVIYCRGKDNILADCLSRYPVDPPLNQDEPSQSNIIEISVLKHSELFKTVSRNLKNLVSDQRDDPFCSNIIAILEGHNSVPENIQKWYLLSDVLYRRGEDDAGLRICIPKKHVPTLVRQEHEDRGHFGANKVYLALQKYFFWPKMRSKIRSIVATCQICQQTKISPRLHGELHSVITDAPNKLVCLDLMGPLPRSKAGATQLLVVIDSFSKLVTLYPLRRATTQTVFRKLKEHYFTNVGKPEVVLSDNGTQFSKKWKELLTVEGVKVAHTSNYYPQGNLTERINREIGRLLRHLCYHSHGKWAHVVPQVMNWLNDVIHENTGFTPAEIHFGRVRSEPVLEKLGFDLKTCPKNIKVLAHERLVGKAEKRRLRHSRKYSSSKLNVGDRVWLRTHPQSSAEDAKIKKFFLLYEGPYEILKQVGPNAYELLDSKGNAVKHNIYNLKKYVPPQEILD